MSETAPQPLVYPEKTEISEKDRAFATCRQNGMTVRELEKAFGMAYRSGYSVEKRLRKIDLTDSKMLSLAYRAKKNILEGKTWGEVDGIKASDVNSAADSVLDRAYPKVHKTQNETLNVTLSVVDLDGYRGQTALEGGSGVLEGKVVSALPEDVETAETGVQEARADDKGKELGEYG